MSKPIVLIPGMGASMLINRQHPYNNYFGKKVLSNRWINLYPLSSKYMERWKKDMRMEFVRNPEGTITGYDFNPDIHPYDVYGIQGIQNLVHEFDHLNEGYKTMLQQTFHYQYMKDLNGFFMERMYIPKKNLIGMPYDFRLMLDPIVRLEYFKKLKHIIESKYYHYRKKNIIIAHSLGGILIKWFLSEYVDESFMDRYIDRLIVINSPFGGTPNAVKACLFGEFYVPFIQSLFIEFTGRVSGIIMCLPNSLCYKKEDTFIRLEDSKKEISLDTFYKQEGSKHCSFQAWKDLYEPYLNILSKPLNLPTTIIISNGQPTAKYFHTKNLESTPYKIEYDMNGDGLIPSKSLHVATRLFHNHQVLHIPSDHVGVLSHPIFLNEIDKHLMV